MNLGKTQEQLPIKHHVVSSLRQNAAKCDKQPLDESEGGPTSIPVTRYQRYLGLPKNVARISVICSGDHLEEEVALFRHCVLRNFCLYQAEQKMHF